LLLSKGGSGGGVASLLRSRQVDVGRDCPSSSAVEMLEESSESDSESESELPFFTSLIAGAAAGLCFGGALVRGFLVIALLLGATATFIDFIDGFALAFTFTDFIAFFAFAPRLLELAPAAAAVAIALVRAIANVGSESVHEQV